MSRDLLAGSVLNAIAGSTERWPAWQVLVWNPNQVSMSDVATDQAPVPALDISPYIESIHYEENIGFENLNNPTVTKAQFKLRRNAITGKNIRRGLIEDGVIVRILQGDERVSKEDWVPVFTGTFRGRPGDDPGTPSQLTEGFDATAYGREEDYLNFNITTQVFTGPIDVGVIALAIAAGTTGVDGLSSGTSFPLTFPVNAVFFRTDLQIAYQNTGTVPLPVWTAVTTPGDTPGMGLSQDEILFGAQGFQTLHLSNQIVNTNCLDALWQIFFLMGKKPKFDSRGRLTAVDVDLDKPAVRIFSAGDITVEAIQSQPNDIEVNNQVVLHGLDHNLSQIVQAVQMLTSLDAVTGFFDDVYKKKLTFSNDASQAALATYLVSRKKIWFSDATWEQTDAFHGELRIDTHYLFDARATIFALYLVSELGIAAIDYFFDEASTGVSGIIVTLEDTATAGGTVSTLAALRLALKIASQVLLAGLLWSMNYIGRGTYEIWGQPFQYAYQELVAQVELLDLEPQEVKTYDFRNDFLSQMSDIVPRAKQMLRRELVKNQLYQITIMDDFLVELDDVIQTSSGERFYVNTVVKDLARDKKATVTLTCWKVFDPTTNVIEALMNPPSLDVPPQVDFGYGVNYGQNYGEGL